MLHKEIGGITNRNRRKWFRLSIKWKWMVECFGLAGPVVWCAVAAAGAAAATAVVVVGRVQKVLKQNHINVHIESQAVPHGKNEHSNDCKRSLNTSDERTIERMRDWIIRTKSVS